ncbi:MAG: BON domain-containing protein [Vulcanimicrobiaceae bacterium]
MKRFMFALLAAGALAGCTEQHMEDTAHSIASAAPGFADDAAIVAQVEAKLVTLDPSSALHVAVESHGGDVSLSGKVRSGESATRFEKAAAAISGVHHVAARLTVDASLPNAADQARNLVLEAAVRANLAAQAGLIGLQVGVSARDGAVTLSGPVKSEALRSTILTAAKQTSGVKRVVDKLEVRS